MQGHSFKTTVILALEFGNTQHLLVSKVYLVKCKVVERVTCLMQHLVEVQQLDTHVVNV